MFSGGLTIELASEGRGKIDREGVLGRERERPDKRERPRDGLIRQG